MEPEFDPAQRTEVGRSVFSATLVLALLTVAGGLVLNLGRASGLHALHAQLEFFAVFTALSVFILAAAKYYVSRHPVYLPLALGFLAAALFDLIHPAVEPGAGGAGLRTQERADLLALASSLTYAGAFLVAARAFGRPVLDDAPTRRLVYGILLTIGGASLVTLGVLLVDLPGLAQSRVGPLLAAPLVPFALSVAATVLLVSDRTRTEPGVRIIGLLSLGFALLATGLWLFSQAPYDRPFFASHTAKVGSYLLVVFGLYVEHVRLYSIERGLRSSLETAHADVRRAKKELEAIIEDLTDGVVVVDAKGRILRMNQSAREITGADYYGLDPAEIARQAILTTPDGQPVPAGASPVMRAIHSGSAVSGIELVVARPNGERRTIVAGAIPLRDERGRLYGAVAAFNDVTDIRAADQRLRDLTETAPDGILVVDDQWRIVLVNHAAERLLGRRRDELLDHDVEAIVPERQRPDFHAARQAIGTAPRLSRTLDLRLQRGDGSDFPVEVTVSASVSPAGTRLIAHLRDATERERVRRLRDGRLAIAQAASAPDMDTFLHRAAETVPRAAGFEACAIYLRDPERNELVLRGHHGVPPEVVERMHRYPLERGYPALAVQTWFEARPVVESELKGRTDVALWPEAAQTDFHHVVNARIGGAHDPLGVLQVASGEHRPASPDDVDLVEDLAHAIASGVRQKQLIEQLESSAEELRAANRELDSFMYTASHDLAEPLRSISNFSHFLLEDYGAKLDEEGRDYLQRVHGGALRMKRLLDDILRLSRIGRVKAPRVRVSVKDVVQEVRESLDAVLRDAKAEVRLEGSVPDLLADRTSVMEVFANLLTNGVKFNQSPNPLVTVRGRREGAFVELAFQDNGIGIAPEHQGRIFGLFTRLHTRKEYPGTGAGLAIVKKIVETQGGRVRVESALGQGSTFLVTLPAWGAPPPRLEVAQPGAPAP